MQVHPPSTSSTSPMAIPTVTTPVDPSRPTPNPAGARECHLDPDGFFGSIGQSEVVISFRYELETSASIDTKRTILSLERSFNSAILPEIFSKICVHPRGQPDGRQLATIVHATGISTKPDDSILQSAVCGHSNDGTNVCRVVQGGLTIYVDDGADEVESQIIGIIKGGMSNDDFLSAAKGIKRVTFLETAPDRNAATGTDKSPTASPPSRPNLNILYGVLAALAAIALAILAVVVWRRQHEQEDGDNSDQHEEGVPEYIEADPDVDFDAEIITAIANNGDVEARAVSMSVDDPVAVQG